MAASVEQVISMMHNKKHDLGEIAIRNLEGCYIYAKLYKLHYDRFEHHFGEAFFKYLFHKDASTYISYHRIFGLIIFQGHKRGS